MFRAKKLTKGPPERSRDKNRPSGSKLQRSRGAEHVASGRVTKKTRNQRAVSPTTKLESLKLKLAAKGIEFDRRHVRKDEHSLANAYLYKQKMSVTPDPERKCTEDEIEKIQDALLDALEPLEDGCLPQFYGSYTVKGVLVMSCANELTKLWLERTVPKLQPWENGKLCVKPKGEVSQGTKVLFKTPKLFAKTDPKKILQMISTQNKTLETNMWKNVSAKSEDTGQTLIYVIDNPSLEAIRALNNKLFLGLGSVDLVILNDEEDGDKQNSADTDMKSVDETDKETSVDTEMKDQEDTDKKTSEEKEMNKQDDNKQTSVDTEMKNQDDDKQTSVDTEMKNQDDDKQTSADTEMKDQDDNKKTSEDKEMKNQDDDKQTSVDTEMKDQDDDDKKTSEDKEMKNQDDTQMSADKEIKRLEENDKQTPADTEMTPSEGISV